MIKVSVVIPVYNAEKYLAECLDSVVNQTLRDIEIICVNDGSTDNSAEILSRYAQNDERFIIIEQHNRGVSAARNVALKVARGEYVGFVDSDDYVSLDFFEKLYVSAVENDADIAATNIDRVYANGAKGRHIIEIEQLESFTAPQAKIDAVQIPKYNYICNKIFRKSALAYPLIEGRYYEDIEWLIKIVYYAGSLVSVPQATYYYRKVATSITHKRSAAKTEDLGWAYDALMSFAMEHGIAFAERYYLTSKTKVYLFGVLVLKVSHWKYKVKYKLFGLIPFLTKVRKRL